MTAKTDTTKTKSPARVSWIRYSEQVDRQCEANASPAQVQAAYQAYLKNNGSQGWTSNGAQTYRDAGSQDTFTVGYGAERTYNTRPAQTTTPEATDPMKRLIDKLLIERQYTALTTQQIDAIKTDKAQAHRFINFLIDLPKVTTPAPAPLKVEVLVEVKPEPARARLDFSAIPDGYYALVVDGVTKFYRVSTSKRNGYKNVQVQASDNLHMLFGKAGIAVLHKLVEAGLKESQALYASELGRCYVCGRTLTDETSRQLGIGPICRDGKM
jgi:uncharacterized protein DUF6011